MLTHFEKQTLDESLRDCIAIRTNFSAMKGLKRSVFCCFLGVDIVCVDAFLSLTFQRLNPSVSKTSILFKVVTLVTMHPCIFAHCHMCCMLMALALQLSPMSFDICHKINGLRRKWHMIHVYVGV